MRAVPLLALLLTLATPPQPPSTTQQAFLLLDAYYLLYTYPTPPHLSPRGTLLVPLPVTTDLLGAQTALSPDASTATVRLLGSTFRFTAGSPTAQFNAKPLPLPEPPTPTPERALLVPLLPILNALHIRYSWNPAPRILHIRDPRIFQANPRGLPPPLGSYLVEYTAEEVRRLSPHQLTAFAPLRSQLFVRTYLRMPNGWGKAAYRFRVYLRHVRGLTLPASRTAFNMEAYVLHSADVDPISHTIRFPGVWEAWKDLAASSLLWGTALTVGPSGEPRPPNDRCSLRGATYLCDFLFDSDVAPWRDPPPVMLVLGLFRSLTR